MLPIIVVALIVIVAITLFMIVRRMNAAMDIKGSMAELEEYLASVKERLSELKPYISDYFNTLHTSGDDSLETLNQIIRNLEYRVYRTKELMQKTDAASLAEASHLLASDLDLTDRRPVSGGGKALPVRNVPPDQWEAVVEELFQKIGQTVAEASVTVSTYRRSRRRRKTTLTGLIQAGIKGISDQGRRLSRTLMALNPDEPGKDADESNSENS